MKKYLVVITDQDGVPDYLHPSEIFGADKNDVINVMQENTPREYIKGVFTVKEYFSFINSEIFTKQMLAINPKTNPKAIQLIKKEIINNFGLTNNQEAEEEQIGSEFFNNAKQQEVPQSPPPPPPVQAPPPIKKEIRYFKDGDSQFKLDNGVLYKKVWENVNLSPTTGPNGEQILPEIRMISLKTNKPINNSKYGIQQLVWKKIN